MPPVVAYSDAVTQERVFEVAGRRVMVLGTDEMDEMLKQAEQLARTTGGTWQWHYNALLLSKVLVKLDEAQQQQR